jgi:NADH:ubiquinone oxidoreductase subunit F (NADH-binding)
VTATARIAHWMAAQSAGQCGPCVHGLPSIAHALDALVAGDKRGRWERQLHRWLDLVEGRGACHHPDGVARMVRSALNVFAKEIASHGRSGPCRAQTPALALPDWQGPWQ